MEDKMMYPRRKSADSKQSSETRRRCSSSSSRGRNKTDDDDDTPRCWIATPAPTDVKCGQNKCYSQHEGNIRFRSLILSFQDDYAEATTKRSKSRITKEIVHILQSSYGARFIRLDEETNKWEEISERHARDKVSHALRFASTKPQSSAAILKMRSELAAAERLRRSTSMSDDSTMRCNNDYDRKQPSTPRSEDSSSLSYAPSTPEATYNVTPEAAPHTYPRSRRHPYHYESSSRGHSYNYDYRSRGCECYGCMTGNRHQPSPPPPSSYHDDYDHHYRGPVYQTYGYGSSSSSWDHHDDHHQRQHHRRRQYYQRSSSSADYHHSSHAAASEHDSYHASYQQQSTSWYAGLPPPPPPVEASSSLSSTSTTNDDDETTTPSGNQQHHDPLDILCNEQQQSNHSLSELFQCSDDLNLLMNL